MHRMGLYRLIVRLFFNNKMQRIIWYEFFLRIQKRSKGFLTYIVFVCLDKILYLLFLLLSILIYPQKRMRRPFILFFHSQFFLIIKIYRFPFFNKILWHYLVRELKILNFLILYRFIFVRYVRFRRLYQWIV